MNDLRDDFRQTRAIAVVRRSEPEVCLRLAEAYRKGGLRLMELTFDQTGDPAATAAAIRAVRGAFGDDLHVGAGTVLTAAQLDLAAEAGAEFAVSPATDPAIVRRAREAGLLTMPGAFTPTEIATAAAAGADFVKLFPARALGPRYVKDVLAPLGGVRLVATGGVDAGNAGDFVRAGCYGVGGGGPLVKREWIEAGDWERIEEAARALVESVRAAVAERDAK